jgi:hypothetical protein
MGKRQKKLGNKGQAPLFFLENAFRIGFLMVALLAFFLLVNMYISNKMDTNRLEAEVLANRIIYSDTIMYQDAKTSRIYPGIVDMDRFDEGILNTNIDYQNKRHIAANITLINNQNGAIVGDIYLNKQQYAELNILTMQKSTGKGSATHYIKNYPVTYKNTNGYDYGTLVIDIIVPNS